MKQRFCEVCNLPLEQHATNNAIHHDSCLGRLMARSSDLFRIAAQAGDARGAAVPDAMEAVRRIVAEIRGPA